MDRVRPKVLIQDITEAPNLELLKKTFDISEKDTIISYGDAIYSPNRQMTADLLQHELIHCERQGLNRQSAERWWEKYLQDENFRLQEEVIAYRGQYAFCCKVYKDKNRRYKIARALADELSSSRYGKIISTDNAYLLITQNQ